VSAKASIANDYRAAVIPKLEVMAQAAKVADTHAWSMLHWPDGDTAVDFTADSGTGVVAMREDLDLCQADLPLRFATLDFDPVRASLQMLELATDPHEYILPRHARFYANHLAQVARATHVLVVVTDQIRLPKVDLDKFDGGQVHGVAVLVELANADLRGAFHYVAVNRDQVTGTDDTIHVKLRTDLAREFGNKLLAGIRQRFPSATPPLTFGY
jgi:hypothetical protein